MFTNLYGNISSIFLILFSDVIDNSFGFFADLRQVGSCLAL